jgi:hypothetical protein
MLLSVSAQAIAQTRSGPRYVLQDATVVDARSQLIWQRCSIGQQWDGSRCDGKARQMNWYEAQKLAGEEWRLPSKSELEQLVDHDREEKGLAPFIDVSAFPDMNKDKSIYWTSSKGVTGCFGTGFVEEIKDAGFNDGFLPCIVEGAVRLVKGKPKPRGPWAE